MKKLVEIRSYLLKPGCIEKFEQLFKTISLPMLQRWDMDVVAFGRSAHASNAWFLIRTYDNVAERKESQDAFYGSQEWREGPREEIISMIESSHDTLLWLSPSSIVDLANLNGAK